MEDAAARKEEERLKRAFEKANNPALKAKEEAERQKKLVSTRKTKSEEDLDLSLVLEVWDYFYETLL